MGDREVVIGLRKGDMATHPGLPMLPASFLRT